MVSFIRWQPAPIILGYVEPILPAPCPQANKFEYALPVQVGDTISFVSDAQEIGYTTGGPYFIGIMDEECKNIKPDYTVGFPTGSEDGRQMFVNVTIPVECKENKCYRLIFFGILEDATPWTPTGVVSCQTDEEGNNTGWQLVEQTRDATYEYTPFFVSNPLRVCAERESTKLIEFKGNSIDFGVNYPAFPEFIQSFRLHLTIAEPSHPISTGTYRQTNGRFVRKNTFIDKQRVLHTGYMDELTHDALVNALHHDLVIINGLEYFATGDYEESHRETRQNKDRYDQLYTATQNLLLQGYNQRNRACELEENDFRVYDDQYQTIYE